MTGITDMIIATPATFMYGKGAIKQMMKPVAKHELSFCFVCEGLRKTKLTVRGDKICNDCDHKLDTG